MTTQTERRLMTAEELLNMPDDGFSYELVRGELRKKLLAGSEEGTISADVASSLGLHVKSQGLGKTYISTGFIIETNPDHVRAPNVAFVRQERVEVIGRTDFFWPEAPTLAVDYISPDDRYTEVNEKVADWLAAGTRMVVVVNPRNRTVNVHTPDGAITLTIDDTLDGGDVVSGWQMPVADIFAEW